MGMIADRLRAQLAEMRERHAQTDRELAEARQEALDAFARLTAAHDALEAELN